MAGATVSPAQYDREKSLGYLVNRLARLMSRALEKRLAAHGVALGQFAVMLALWEEEGITQSEIARRLAVEQPTVANTLARMRRDGLVSTAPDPDNQRQVLIYLTEKGRALKAPLTGEALHVSTLVGATLSADELESFVAQLTRLCAEFSR